MRTSERGRACAASGIAPPRQPFHGTGIRQLWTSYETGQQAITGADAENLPLRIKQQVGMGQSRNSTESALQQSRSPELEVNDAAIWLELRANGQTVQRVPVRLNRGVVNVLRQTGHSDARSSALRAIPPLGKPVLAQLQPQGFRPEHFGTA